MERFLNAVGAVKESSIISEERKDVAIEMAQQIVREREQQVRHFYKLTLFRSYNRTLSIFQITQLSLQFLEHIRSINGEQTIQKT